MKYRWLHISDLHTISSGIRTKIMRAALMEEVKDLNSECSFSFIVITGDISDKNQGYDEAKQLIHEIVNAAEVKLENVFIVPGNHDLDRSVPDNRYEIVNEAKNNEVLDDKEEKYFDELYKAQEKFRNAYLEILGTEYDGDKIHFSKIIDSNIVLFHLNTSWMCYDSETESGKLHIGLNNVCRCFDDEKVSNYPIKIAIGHHRLSDFSSEVKNSLRSLFMTKGIDLYLGGHCHESDVIYDPVIDTEFCSCRQARADALDYPAGFIIGDINTDDDQSSFQFYNWDNRLAKWTFDYTVKPAKHGKYYLRGDKFTNVLEANRNIIVDFKLFGLPLNYNLIANELKITNYAIYKSSLKGVKFDSEDKWKVAIKDIQNLYCEIMNDSNVVVNIFAIAPTPLQVALGYLIQNDNPFINIYQYHEIEEKWVYDELDEEVEVISNYKKSESTKLAVAVSVSGSVEEEDITKAMGEDYDLLSINVKNPRLSLVNYKEDVLRVKKKLQKELNKIYTLYSELHLFIAAPSGLCIEIGRIIRKNMYPPTYVYNYKWSDDIKYKNTLNLMDIDG